MTPARAAAPALRANPYLPLTQSDRYDKLVRLGWRLGAGPPIPLDQPIDWAPREDALRSWHYHLQALDLIEPALIQWSVHADRHALALATTAALDWARAHVDSPDDDAAWYDMAVGLRAYRLSYLLGEARGADLIDDADERLLLGLFQRHVDHLADEARFSAHSNHGFFQAAGLLAVVRRILRPQDRAAGLALATGRLRGILDRHFAADGVHREHSPDYHLVVLEGFKALIRADLLDDPGMFEKIARAERALSWFVKPDGRLVNFGDSDNRVTPPAVLEDLQPLKSGMRAFAEGGYAVVRQKGERGATYLAQTLCFHSRTHKQADDLSFVWMDRGQDILIDAGRYAYGRKTAKDSAQFARGFWYADPNRVFVETTGAHNTVEIDGESYDRRAKPYGSALRAAGELGGVRYVLGEVRHGSVTHARLLLLSPGQWLCVVDGLGQTGGQAHTFRQWHHFEPSWTVTAEAGRLAAVREGVGPGESLSVTSLVPAEIEGPLLGEGKPHRQGWWSPAANRIEPAPAAAFVQTGRQAVFATVFAFEDNGAVSGRVSMKPDLTGELRLDIGRRRLRIHRDHGDIEIAFRSAR